MASTTSSSITVTRPPASCTSTARHARSNRSTPDANTASTSPVTSRSTDTSLCTTTHCPSTGFLLPCRHTRAPSSESRVDTRTGVSRPFSITRHPIPRPAAIVTPIDGNADTASAGPCSSSIARSTE
ncbi:MAG TPA: hypothetical protein VF821_09880 [Lentzea sp.]